MGEMNRYERRFRQTGKQLLLLLAIWVGLIVFAAVLPNNLWMSPRNVLAIVFFAGAALVFLMIAVVSVLRMIAYIRWTGKYPYYFLFRRSTVSTDREHKQ